MLRINFALEELQAFVAVAERHSFRAAAEALSLSPPALSRRIDRLETALAVRLLARTTRRVALTAAGEQFLPQARQTLEDLDAAVQGLSDRALARQGLVTIACVPSVAQHALPPVFKAFALKFPDVRLRLIDESAHRVMACVLSGEADFGIGFLGAQEPELVFEAIREEDYVLVMPRDHALAGRQQLRWSALVEERMVAVNRQSANRLLLDNALATLPQRPRVHYEAEHVAGALGLVEAGLGVAALPRLAVPRDHPRLCSARLTEPRVSRVLGLLNRRDRVPGSSAQALQTLVRRALAG